MKKFLMPLATLCATVYSAFTYDFFSTVGWVIAFLYTVIACLYEYDAEKINP